jgi:hypothetical protein
MVGEWRIKMANDDFFSLAQLEQPQMMPSAPSGGGALAGLMYGQDKARQDKALQGATNLAQLNAMLQQQHASEDMAGAPGRMDTIQRGNLMAAGGLANAPTDVDTGASKSRAENIKAHLDALTPYAMGYRDTMTNDDFNSLRDSMKAGGITKIGNKNLDDVSDEQLEKVLKDTKNYAVNTPKHLQEMEKEGLIVQGWQDRNAVTGNSREEVARITQEGRIKTQEMRDKAKIDAVKLTEMSKSGRLNMGQYRAQLYQRAEQGDDYAREVLMRLDTQDLAKAAAQAQNSGAHVDVKEGAADLAPPVIPKAPPFPQRPGAGAPPPPANPGAQKSVKVGVEGKTLIIDGKEVKAKAYNPDTKQYLLDDGTIIGPQK